MVRLRTEDLLLPGAGAGASSTLPPAAPTVRLGEGRGTTPLRLLQLQGGLALVLIGVDMLWLGGRIHDRPLVEGEWLFWGEGGG